MLQEIMQFISRNTILSLVWIALLVAVIVMTAKSAFSKCKEITRAQAIHLINKEDAVVVDLRSRDDFRKGHIIGSVNLIPSEIKDNNLGELEKHKKTTCDCRFSEWNGSQNTRRESGAFWF